MSATDNAENDPAPVELDGYAADALRRLREARRAAHDWDRIADEARDELLKSIGESARTLTVDGEPVATVSRYAPERFDSARFARDHGRLYSEYLRAGAPVTRVVVL